MNYLTKEIKMKTKIKLLAIAFLLLSTAIFAQKKDYSDEPGYVNFGNLSDFESEEMVTEVILESHLLKMVSKLAKNEDMELSELIGGLKLIKVNVFEVNKGNENEITDRIVSIDKRLMSEGWDRIVKSKSREESAYVFIKTESEDNIYGLVVMAVERSGEAVFVNIVGDINLETIGKLGAKFDIPSLDHINKNKD
jgi:hypothetical protein